MDWFNNLQVKQKLTLLIAVFVFAIVGVSVANNLELKKSSSRMDQLYTTNVKQIQLAYKDKVLLHQTVETIYALIISTEASENQRLKTDLAEIRKELDENIATYEKLPFPSPCEVYGGI